MDPHIVMVNALSPEMVIAPRGGLFSGGGHHLVYHSVPLHHLHTEFEFRLRKDLRLNMDEKTKNCLVIMAALFLVLSCSTVSLDVYTIWKKLFYRLFHGAEQKTPFLTALTAIFAMAASTSRFASIAFICLSLYSLNSTVFQMISYLYLSSNGYFGDHLCELFFPAIGRCHLSVTKSGSTVFFFKPFLIFFFALFCSIVFHLSFRTFYCVRILMINFRSNYTLHSSTVGFYGVNSMWCFLRYFNPNLLYSHRNREHESTTGVTDSGESSIIILVFHTILSLVPILLACSNT
uniref:CASP-like protein n=1 Tax=Angiostrongylus cantonensis TaxID=6313 RepID=A0A0K0DMV4_ANGCA